MSATISYFGPITAKQIDRLEAALSSAGHEVIRDESEPGWQDAPKWALPAFLTISIIGQIGQGVFSKIGEDIYEEVKPSILELFEHARQHVNKWTNPTREKESKPELEGPTIKIQWYLENACNPKFSLDRRLTSDEAAKALDDLEPTFERFRQFVSWQAVQLDSLQTFASGKQEELRMIDGAIHRMHTVVGGDWAYDPKTRTWVKVL